MIKKLPVARENVEQKAFVKWLYLSRKYIFDRTVMIANQGKRSSILGADFKRMGLKKGVSDLFIAYPTKTKSGLWIELKRRDSRYRATVEQLLWIQLMITPTKFGLPYLAKVCAGWEEARDTVLRYLEDDD